MNPGFQAFLDLKKYIAEKLGVSNGPVTAEGRKHFDKNTNHYKQMIPK